MYVMQAYSKGQVRKGVTLLESVDTMPRIETAVGTGRDK